MIVCVLAGNHRLLRESFGAVLEQHGNIKTHTHLSDARTAAEHAVDINADLLLLNPNIHGSDPFEAVRWMRSSAPRIKALFLDRTGCAERFQAAVECGASGYFEKSAGSMELILAVEKIVHGEQYFPNRFENVECNKLSPREREITKFLVEGNTVKETAILLGISSDTVTTHKFNIFRKLGVHNRVQLTNYAIAHKMAQPLVV